MDGRRLTGFEALVRWRNAERGIVPPSEFIPVAEETGLIGSLGEWVLREARGQMKEWLDRFSFRPLPTIAVNVSYHQLTGQGFVDCVRDILYETRLPAECLRLEMTESAVMKNPEESIETLRQLKALGIGLEIDDFGTGYSSLGYLSYLPFDTVKIDRVFVSQLGVREEGTEIVRTILGLAASLSLDVIAEGVETEAQRQRLAELGCTRAQGYFFSKPVPAELVPERMQAELIRQGFARLEARDEGPAPRLLPAPASAAQPTNEEVAA
jgi:EAL domain-containing protein (putative c-di-GMP-specific phosphodiesterase class I)